MRLSSPEKRRRQQSRFSAVLPVKVRGTDSDGKPFEEVAHTLDITATGARLAAIRRALKVMDHLIVVYRHRRIAFLIVWTKLVGKHEYQVGLQAIGEQKEAWGLNSSDYKSDVHTSVR
jgi:hypothetical protein